MSNESFIPADKWESMATDLAIDRMLEEGLGMTPAALTDKAMRLRAENKERITFEQLVGETLDVKAVASLWLSLLEWKTSASAVEKAIADRLAVLLTERGSGLDVDGHAVFLTKGTKRETCIDEPAFFDWLRSNPDTLDRVLNPNAVKKGSLPPAVRDTFFEQTIEVKPDFVPAPASVPLEVLEDIKQRRGAMTDEYDVFDESEIEDRLLRKSRVEGRDRLREAIALEIGFRAAVQTQAQPRDLRWFQGLFR